MNPFDAPQDRLVYRKFQEGVLPPNFCPAYVSSVKRAPRLPLVPLPQTISELTGPTFTPPESVQAVDLTKGAHGAAIGERIVVGGRVLDEDGRAIAGTLVEIWQANAAGRYLHARDQHDAPLDPNFTGCASLVTDAKGQFRFETIRPGEYPWRNHYNAWRPAHIHFSVFGPAFATRLVTRSPRCISPGMRYFRLIPFSTASETRQHGSDSSPPSTGRRLCPNTVLGTDLISCCEAATKHQWRTSHDRAKDT